MRGICPISLPLILCFSLISCKQQTINPLALEADSLLQTISALNQEIMAANLDSINQVYSILSSDRVMMAENLSQLPDNVYDKELIRQFDTTVLTIGLCLGACNDFHQELSVIERHLNMIRADISKGQKPDSTIEIRISREAELFEDLKTRIYQRLDILRNQLKIYNELEPEIQSYKEQLSLSRFNE